MSTILGIDLGKFKSVACRYEADTHEATFATVVTDPDTLRAVLERTRPDRVALEARTATVVVF